MQCFGVSHQSGRVGSRVESRHAVGKSQAGGISSSDVNLLIDITETNEARPAEPSKQSTHLLRREQSHVSVHDAAAVTVAPRNLNKQTNEKQSQAAAERNRAKRHTGLRQEASSCSQR